MRLVCPRCSAPFFAPDTTAGPKCPNCGSAFPTEHPADAVPVARPLGPAPGPPVRSRAATVLGVINALMALQTAVYMAVVFPIASALDRAEPFLVIVGGLAVVMAVSAVGLLGRWRVGWALAVVVAAYAALVGLAAVLAFNPCGAVVNGAYTAFAFRVLVRREAWEEFGGRAG